MFNERGNLPLTEITSPYTPAESCSRLGMIWTCLRRAIRVDFAKDPTNMALARNLELENSRSFSLGFGNDISQIEIWAACGTAGLQNRSEEVALVLKLSLALLAYGHNTVDAETLLLDVCRNLKLLPVQWDLGMRRLYVSFNGQSTYLLFCKRGIAFDKLVATTRLANHLAEADAPNVKLARQILDKIVESPSPYGWFVQIISYECFCMCAAVAAFSGTYFDSFAAGLIGPAAIFTSKLCEMTNVFGKLEGIFVPMAVGLVTPIVWLYLLPEVHVCHVTVWILSSVLIFLPGLQLIYGTYELEAGSVVDGTSRLVFALVQVMFLVMGLTIGWQLFGYNAASKYVGEQGYIASLPPSSFCTGNQTIDPANQMDTAVPWLLISGVYNIPLLFFLCVNLNLRLREILGPILSGYLSLLAHGSLLHGKEYGLPDLPPLVINAIGVFLAGSLGGFHEFLTGTPAILTVLPVVLVYAPGAGAVQTVLASLHIQAGDVKGRPPLDGNVWGDLILKGVSYAVGMYLSAVIWRPINRRRQKKQRHSVDRELMERDYKSFRTIASVGQSSF